MHDLDPSFCLGDYSDILVVGRLSGDAGVVLRLAPKSVLTSHLY